MNIEAIKRGEIKDLRGVDLRCAYLRGADLRCADLRCADLRCAYLRDADLQGANLQGANLQGADLRNAIGFELALARASHIPSEGSFIAWKKCHSSLGGDTVIVKLLVPAEAKRSHGAERKCRAEFVDPLEIFGLGVGISDYAPDGNPVIYEVGKRVVADSWDEDRWNTCSHGIHFFMTREEAEDHRF